MISTRVNWSDLPLLLGRGVLAGVAGRLVGGQGRGVCSFCVMRLRCCVAPARSRGWAGRTGRSWPRWPGCCPDRCGCAGWLPRVRCCVGISGWSPVSGPSPGHIRYRNRRSHQERTPCPQWTGYRRRQQGNVICRCGARRLRPPNCGGEICRSAASVDPIWRGRASIGSGSVEPASVPSGLTYGFGVSASWIGCRRHPWMVAGGGVRPLTAWRVS